MHRLATNYFQCPEIEFFWPVANSDCSCNRCIPYRLREDKEDCSSNIENRIQVLMVSSPSRNDLVFPKVYIFLSSHISDAEKWVGL